MAESVVHMQVDLTDKMSAVLQETREELQRAQEALSEERIRQIVREELEAWERRQLQALRSATGAPLQGAALVHESRPDLEPVHLPKGSIVVPNSEPTERLKGAKVTLALDGTTLARVREV